MNKTKRIGCSLLTALVLAGCGSGNEASTTDNTTVVNPEEQTVMKIDLLKEWQGPYGGVPAFDKMDLAEVKPAMEKGMALHLAEIEKIANNPEAPTFENTILAMQKAGKELDRAYTYYGIWSSNISSPEFRKIQEDLAPKLSEYSSKISQNQQLFKRIKTVYDNSLKNSLPQQQQRAVQLIYEDFAMQGADLSPEAKERYAEINMELSKLYTQFSNNVLAEEENYVVYLDKDQLSGLARIFREGFSQSGSRSWKGR